MAANGTPLVISGDSHVIEPAELWTKPLGARYGDAAPQMVSEYGGTKADHFFTGFEYVRVDEIVEGDEELQKKLVGSGTDPAIRMTCMEEDGVYGEIVNSTWMLSSRTAAGCSTTGSRNIAATRRSASTAPR